MIKRIPGGFKRLTVSEIKQIGGRAGRYRSAAQTGNQNNEEENVGYVTSLESVDLPYIRAALSEEPPPIATAGIFPPEPVFHKFAAYFPRSVPFGYIIDRLLEVSQVSPLFFMCDADGQQENTEIIDAVDGLRIDDQLCLMAAPLFLRDSTGWCAARAFAICIASHTNGRLLDIPELNLEALEKPVSGDKQYLQELESLHKSIILYAWLSFRIGGVFTDRTLAAHVKELVEERMVRALTEFSANKKLRKDSSLRRQIALQKQIQEQNQIMSDANIDSIETSETGATNAPDDIPDHASERFPDDVSDEAGDEVAEDTDTSADAPADEETSYQPAPEPRAG